MIDESKYKDIAKIRVMEQSLTHSIDNLRILDRRVSMIEKDLGDLKINQKVTDQTVIHILDSLTDLKSDFKTLDYRMGDNLKSIQNEVKQSNNKMYDSQIEQLDIYKSTLWKIGGSVIGSIIVAVTVFLFNI